MGTHIEALARQKDFFQLAPAERSAVLSEMTEEEYEQLHLTISTLHSMDAETRPSPQLRERLLRRMAEAGQPRWHSRPVPLWQAAAAAALAGAVVAACFFPKKSQRPVEQPVAQVEVRVQHDTVRLTQWAYRNRVVRIGQPEPLKEKLLASPPQAFVKMSPAPDAPPAAPMPSAEFSLPPAQPIGTPMSALPELMQFLGGEGKR